MAANWWQSATTSPVIQNTLQATQMAPTPDANGPRNMPSSPPTAEGTPKTVRLAFEVLKAVQLQSKGEIRPAWAEPFLAVQDTVYSQGRPVVVKSCPKATYHLLKNSLVNVRSNLVLRLNMPAEISAKSLEATLMGVGKELAQLPKDHPVTLQVFWNADSGGVQTVSLADLLTGGKSALGAKDGNRIDEGSEGSVDGEDADAGDDGDDGEDGAGAEGTTAGKPSLEKGILALQQLVSKAHHHTKLVVFTPATTLQASSGPNASEVFDASALGYKLHQDGYEHKVAKLHTEYAVAAPLEATRRALRGVAYKDLGPVFRDATLVSSRHALAGLQTGDQVRATPPQLLHLLMANERLRNRSAGSIDEACKHIKRVRSEEAALLDAAPEGVRQFCNLVRKFDQVRVLAPHVERGLLLEGDKDDGKEAVARALAAGLGEGFLFAPDRTELLAMIASGKGKGLSTFLTEVNNFAHQQKCRGVVYLADLADLLQTVDRVSEQGLLVRGLLAKLLRGFGSEAHRDRLVLVAAARDVEALGPELALRFGTHTFVGPPNAAQRLQLWRSELTDATNAAITDEALRDRVLPACAGFARSDVQQAVAWAAQQAVSNATGAALHLTVEDLFVGIRAHAHTRRDPEWRRVYA